MSGTTLRGIFPEPKPVPRRNFIRENVKSIKQMQSFLQEAGVIQPRPSKDDKYQNVRPQHRQATKNTPQMRNRSLSKDGQKQLKKLALGINKGAEDKMKKGIVADEKFTNRSMQTECTDDLTRLYESGVIKYPSPSVGKGKSNRISLKDKGDNFVDRVPSLEKNMENLGMEERDYIKENMNVRPKPFKLQTTKVPAKPPPNYQRGVVPKYLKERKEEEERVEEVDESCPEGHVLLPEDERKETLRVLRQSYADRIQELNSLPVRSDTLRVKKRKMEIEEELKRIDGGIKVFQRPKVYVKINA